MFFLSNPLASLLEQFFLVARQPLICCVSPFTCVLSGPQMLVSPVGDENATQWKKYSCHATYYMQHMLKLRDSVVDQGRRQPGGQCGYVLDLVPVRYHSSLETSEQIDTLRFKCSCIVDHPCFARSQSTLMVKCVASQRNRYVVTVVWRELTSSFSIAK